MRKILFVLVLLLSSNLHAQPKSSDKTSFDYSKFVGLWYHKDAATLCIWKEKNELKVAQFSTYSGNPIEVLALCTKNKRLYVESLYCYTSWYTIQEYTYLSNDTLSVIITGDANDTIIYTRYDFKTYNPPFFASTDENWVVFEFLTA